MGYIRDVVLKDVSRTGLRNLRFDNAVIRQLWDVPVQDENGNPHYLSLEEIKDIIENIISNKLDEIMPGINKPIQFGNHNLNLRAKLKTMLEDRIKEKQCDEINKMNVGINEDSLKEMGFSDNYINNLSNVLVIEENGIVHPRTTEEKIGKIKEDLKAEVSEKIITDDVLSSDYNDAIASIDYVAWTLADEIKEKYESGLTFLDLMYYLKEHAGCYSDDLKFDSRFEEIEKYLNGNFSWITVDMVKQCQIPNLISKFSYKIQLSLGTVDISEESASLINYISSIDEYSTLLSIYNDFENNGIIDNRQEYELESEVDNYFPIIVQKIKSGEDVETDLNDILKAIRNIVDKNGYELIETTIPNEGEVSGEELYNRLFEISTEIGDIIDGKKIEWLNSNGYLNSRRK